MFIEAEPLAKKAPPLLTMQEPCMSNGTMVPALDSASVLVEPDGAQMLRAWIISELGWMPEVEALIVTVFESELVMKSRMSVRAGVPADQLALTSQMPLSVLV